MYKKVLVPLDGSELAECSLPHVKNLAKDGSVGEVILLNVITLALPLMEINLDDSAMGNIFDFTAFRNQQREKSQKYLAGIQSRLSADGIKIKTESLEADTPVHAIVDYALKNSADLIVIATHGYTGMKKMLFGSTAFGVLHESHVPVLLIRPESCRG
ncbi:MAG: universal stress protein [Deltaproteobacteria bacterium]|nr:universal stress protein [Deltaproteobacteria bacterium]